jgi:hypothetical protein
MTPQSIRLSLAFLDRFNKSATGLLSTAAFGAALFFVIVQIPTLRAAMDTLVGKLGQIQSVEAMNLKMAFTDSTVLEALPVFKQLESGQQATLRADLQGLDGESLPRLLNVGTLEGTCDYDHTTPDIRASFETDERLHALGLVDMRAADDVKTRALAAMKTTLDQGKEWEAGTPRHCYRMTLTSRGWRVKSAVLEFLSAGLTHGAIAPAVAQAPKPHRETLRVARGD